MFGLFSKKNKEKREDKKAKEEAIRVSRRAFLKKSALATAGIALSPTVNAMGKFINLEEEKLEFTPKPRPESISEESYNDLNKLLQKMEDYFKNNGDVKNLHKDIANMKFLVPHTGDRDMYNNDVYKHICETVLSNPQFFKYSPSRINISNHNRPMKNQENACRKLKKFIETPFRITDMETDINLVVEYECGKRTDAKDTKRTLKHTAVAIANLYDGLYKSGSYNLPEGEKKSNVLKINQNDKTRWGTYLEGYNPETVPEIFGKATLEYDNESDRMYKIAFNMKLAYERTEDINKLISDHLLKIGNKELAQTFNQRAMDYKIKAVTLSSKISQNNSKPGSVKYEFTQEEIDNFLTPGDKNKENSRISILTVPVSQRTSAAKNVESDKLTPLSLFTGSKDSLKYKFYNEEYKDKTLKYFKDVKEPMNYIFKLEEKDEARFNQELERIKEADGIVYHKNDFKENIFKTTAR